MALVLLIEMTVGAVENDGAPPDEVSTAFAVAEANCTTPLPSVYMLPNDVNGLKTSDPVSVSVFIFPFVENRLVDDAVVANIEVAVAFPSVIG